MGDTAESLLREMVESYRPKRVNGETLCPTCMGMGRGYITDVHNSKCLWLRAKKLLDTKAEKCNDNIDVISADGSRWQIPYTNKCKRCGGSGIYRFLDDCPDCNGMGYCTGSGIETVGD